MASKEPSETDEEEIAIGCLAGLDARLRGDPSYGVLVGILAVQLLTALALRAGYPAALAAGALVGTLTFTWWGLGLAVLCLGEAILEGLLLPSPSVVGLLYLASSILALGLLLSRARQYY